MIKIILAAILACVSISAPSNAKTLTLNPERTVHIRGPIGGGSAINQASRIEELAKTAEDIYLVINSPGGEVTLGYLIINSMNVAKERGVKFKCYVPQMAASMAFQVFANCNERYTLSGTYLLWHSVRVSAEMTLTPALTKQLYFELRQIERRMTSELLSVMDVERKFFDYHYNAESLWVASQLNQSVKNFITIVSDVKGLSADYQQFELRSSPFGTSGQIGNRGYKFIYESPYSITVIRQP